MRFLEQIKFDKKTGKLLFWWFVLFAVTAIDPLLFGAEKKQTDFMFGGGYNPSSKKWSGPKHDNILYPWISMYATAGSENELHRALKEARKKGVECIGYYYSASTSYDKFVNNRRRIPEGVLPLSALRPEWVLMDSKGNLVTWPNQKRRFFLNLGKPEVRAAIIGRAVALAKSYDSDMLFFDNWSYMTPPPGDLKREDWALYNLLFLKEARQATNRVGMKLVVNTASYFKYWQDIAPYVDGIAYEMASTPQRLKTRGAYESELATYEGMLIKGKSVFLYTYIPKDSYRAEWDPDGRKIAATALLVMPKNNPHWGGIFVAIPTFEVWPAGGWSMWPRQLGEPLGSREWSGNTVSRNFERGLVRVTVGAEPEFQITFKY